MNRSSSIGKALRENGNKPARADSSGDKTKLLQCTIFADSALY